ncbi:STM3941 family protein [uncultured Sphingomonas sp.]|uniref:STM3941 family protein n=1 Tax=uncultured Sphingomonas sp. TaxID=158754 RepID=UPI0025E7183B|nr:STM3941 family protein [uncultured Sphingomonas sp.]
MPVWQARSSPWRLSALLLLSLLFVVLGIAMATTGELVVSAFGLFAVLLFGTFALVFLRRLLRGREVAIEVSDQGICWLAWSEDLIAWHDIDHVSIRRQGRHHHLCLWLHRPTHFRNALAARGASLSKSMGFGDVAINTIGTDRRFDELVKAVRRYVTPD